MKIVMTMLVRNEDDILRENIEYHLHSGVDFIIITDHHSNDNSYNIAREYAKKGKVEVWREVSNEHHQAEWVSDMAKEALRKFQADWIINNDADEFWVAPNNDLKSFFKSVPEKVWKLHVNRYDFLYRPFKHSKFFEALLFRETNKRWTKACHRSTNDIEVEVGNHNAFSKKFKNCNYESISTNNLEIFHYPIRDPEKYKKKMIDGFNSINCTPGIPGEYFWHWKNAMKYILSGKFEEYLKQYTITRDMININIQRGCLMYEDKIQKFFLTKDYMPT